MNLLEHERTKFDIPLGHLDYEYINKCRNVKELEKILRILRSGHEGFYPEMEKVTESQLSKFDPKNRLLRKSDKLLKPGEINSDEWNNIQDELYEWEENTRHIEEKLIDEHSDNFFHDDLPNIRKSVNSSQNDVQYEKKRPENSSKKNNRIKPREYHEWDKFDVESELKKIDEKKCQHIEKVSDDKMDTKIDDTIDGTGIPDEMKIMMADREKHKGNESFRAGDYKEAILFYNRSISLCVTVPSLNNRAQTYIKLKEWNKALLDCEKVLQLEKNNCKALYRRAVVHKEMLNSDLAIMDLRKLIKIDPNNKEAQNILRELEVRNGKFEKGRKMAICEDSDFEDCDQILTDCNKELMKDFNNTKTLFMRAMAYKKMMHFDESIIDFKTLLKLDPEHKEAKIQLQETDKLKQELLRAKAQASVMKCHKTKRQRINIKEIDEPENTGNSIEINEFNSIKDSSINDTKVNNIGNNIEIDLSSYNENYNKNNILLSCNSASDKSRNFKCLKNFNDLNALDEGIKNENFETLNNIKCNSNIINDTDNVNSLNIDNHFHSMDDVIINDKDKKSLTIGYTNESNVSSCKSLLKSNNSIKNINDQTTEIIAKPIDIQNISFCNSNTLMSAQEEDTSKSAINEIITNVNDMSIGADMLLKEFDSLKSRIETIYSKTEKDLASDTDLLEWKFNKNGGMTVCYDEEQKNTINKSNILEKQLDSAHSLIDEKNDEDNLEKILWQNPLSKKEFLQSLKKLAQENQYDCDIYYNLIRNVIPSDLPRVMYKQLEQNNLGILIKCIKACNEKGKYELSYSYLLSLCDVDRCGLYASFLDLSYRTEIKQIMNECKPHMGILNNDGKVRHVFLL